MGLFNRKKNGDDEGTKKEKGSWRRPASECYLGCDEWTGWRFTPPNFSAL